MTSSAVSHQIKSLENELGRQLFERSSRSLALTETGQSLYEEASPLIEQLDAIAASFRSGPVSSTIRISVQPFFASELFVPRLPEFTASHPEIDIQVGSSDESSEKYPADADMSIRLFRSPPKDLQSDLIFPLRVVPAGSPEFRKALTVKNRKIVSDFPLIVHETYPQAWEQWEERSGIRLPEDSKVTRLDSMIAVARAAERGLGAALVPVPLAQRWLESGSLVRLFKDELSADVSYFLACREDRLRDPGVRALRDWILETFAEAS